MDHRQNIQGYVYVHAAANLLFSSATQEFLCYLQGCEIAGRDAFSSVLMPVENRDGLPTRNCCSFVDKMEKREQRLKALEGGSQSSRVVHPQESVLDCLWVIQKRIGLFTDHLQ